VRIRVSIVLLLALSAVGLAGARTTPVLATAQSDLDAFMKKVLTRRDENWKKLQQYVLDERAEFSLKGPTGIPVWGDRREYTWFIREGYFIRSPLKANGVTLSETDRRKAEDDYLNRLRAREKKDAERQRIKNAPPGEPVEAAPPEAASLDAFLAQAREPDFVESAYFMKFKFDQGRYALVGREPFDGAKQVLRVEYYPTQLFTDDEESAERKKAREKKAKAEDPKKAERREAGNAYAMPSSGREQGVGSSRSDRASVAADVNAFDNVNFDFLPARGWSAWTTSRRRAHEPALQDKDIYAKNVEFTFVAMLAIDYDARVDYHDYREATTSGGSGRTTAVR
jgi:hypothetical protein